MDCLCESTPTVDSFVVSSSWFLRHESRVMPIRNNLLNYLICQLTACSSWVCSPLLERSDPAFFISTESTCGAVNWRIYRHLELIKSNPLHSIISKAFVTETLVAFGVQFSELILHYSCVKIDVPKQSFSLLSEQKLIMFSLIDLIRIWNGLVRGVLFFYLF